MTDAPVLLYDGICGFCNGAVQTILRLDRGGSLRFAALDSDFGRNVIARHPDLADVDSVVFVDNPDSPDERVTV
ncbi:thiol-disulfide oxidoreductase, partial [Mycobacterium sp. ITM-2017-0098]